MKQIKDYGKQMFSASLCMKDSMTYSTPSFDRINDLIQFVNNIGSLSRYRISHNVSPNYSRYIYDSWLPNEDESEVNFTW